MKASDRPARFDSENARRAESGGVTVACGETEYCPEKDIRFQVVFEPMYGDKKRAQAGNP